MTQISHRMRPSAREALGREADRWGHPEEESDLRWSEEKTKALILSMPRYEVRYLRRHALSYTAFLPADYTICGVLSGGAQILLGEKAFDVREGMTILVNPAVRQAMRARRASVEILLVRVHASVIAEMAARLRLTRVGHEFIFREPVVTDPRLQELLGALRHELRTIRMGQEVVVQALVDHMLVHLFRDHLTVRRNLDLEFSRVGFVDRRLRRAIEFIHAHFEEPIRLRDMARAAFLSSFHFARLFKRRIGLTPHAYLAAVRLENAARLLATTDLSILEIAHRVGFTSQSHFAKAFRAWAGVTPREYRQARESLASCAIEREK